MSYLYNLPANFALLFYDYYMLTTHVSSRHQKEEVGGGQWMRYMNYLFLPQNVVPYSFTAHGHFLGQTFHFEGHTSSTKINDKMTNMELKDLTGSGRSSSCNLEQVQISRKSGLYLHLLATLNVHYDQSTELPSQVRSN